MELIQKSKVRIAIPVNERNGLFSLVSHHFGKAKGFMLLDSDGGYAAFINSVDARKEDECAPLTALQDNGCEVILCYSMGQGAFMRCQQAGFKVLRIREGERVIDVMNGYGKNLHLPFGEESICRHHDSHGNGCSH